MTKGKKCQLIYYDNFKVKDGSGFREKIQLQDSCVQVTDISDEEDLQLSVRMDSLWMT